MTTDDRDPSLSAAERRFIERYGGLARTHGFPATVGHVFALVLLSPEPTTAERIAERLGVSVSTAKGGARRLERLGVLERATESGERVARYQIRSGGLAGAVEDVLLRLRSGRDLAAEMLQAWSSGEPVVRERVELLHALQSSAISAVEEVIRQHTTASPDVGISPGTPRG